MATGGRPTRAAVYQRFAAAIDELERFGGLPRPADAGPIWDDIWHLEAHNSTAIEGNTLVLREVEVLLEQRRAVGAKDLNEYMEVLGYGAAAKWVYSHALDVDGWKSGRLITLAEIRHIHAEVMARPWAVEPHPEARASEAPGRFRQHDIAAFAGGMQPVPWTDVHACLTRWIAQAGEFGRNVREKRSAPQETPTGLAELHGSFERIHPFLDGNGRTGRLVLNLILIRLGYPPAIIFKRDRQRYLDALSRADKGDPAALAELLARSVIDNLHRFVVPNIAGPARLVPLASLATKDLSYEALRQAARRGRLEAEQASDGTWRSTRHAVNAYAKNRFKRAARAAAGQ